MPRFTGARSSLLLSLSCACNAPAVAPDPVEEPPIEHAAPAPEPAPPVQSRVAPERLPAPLPEPPAPTAPLPPGAPTSAGNVDILKIVDAERAVVRFFVPGREHAKLWWVALMRRDGAIDWVAPLSGDAAQAEASSGVERAGDSISIATQEIVGNDPLVTLHGFALADGAPRFTTKLGSGFLTNTISDGELRFDTRVNYLRREGGGTESELTATSATGIAWRATIGAPIPVGHDPTIVGDALAVRTEDDATRETRWLVFDRSSGRKRGELLAEPQSCSDGQRWFVRGREGLLEVDAAKVTTRLVLAPPVLPGAAGPWVLEDCTISDGAPVVLVARGARKALVALDPATLAIAGHVELGATSVGMNGFDPLPPTTPRVLALRTLASEAEDIVVADPFAGKLLGRWRDRSAYGGIPMLMAWTGGLVFATRQTIAVISAAGELEGRAVLEDVGIREGQVGGDALWLAPRAGVQLGRAAPRVLALAGPVADDIRDAVLADMVASADAPGAKKGPPCPDPRNVVRGDGIGLAPPLAPVLASRLPAWDLEILHETARTLVCAPGTAPVRLLAWYVMEDDRPLRNDNALLLVEDTSVTPPRHSLVSLYRHASNHAWNTVGSFHDPRSPLRTFDHRPTRAEVDAFLEQLEWTFADGWGRVIAGNVVDDEWRAATGEAPWRSFAPAIERPD